MRARHVTAVAALLFATAASASPRDRILFRGLTDMTFWNTDPGSRLLAENDGEPAVDFGLRLWLGGDMGKGFQAMAVVKGEGGKASPDAKADADLEQGFLRWTNQGSLRMSVDAGRIVTPWGNFTRRYLPNVNPLIGQPDGYGVSYPTGLVLVGSIARFDYRAGVIDQPLVNTKYVPPPGDAYRPGLEVGVTPMIGMRIGAYATAGPYLGPVVNPYLPTGASWRDFEQEVAAVNFEFSRGHFALNAELAASTYDVPTRPEKSRGHQWFIEPVYTWTPRLFTALRVEANDYPYIAPINSFFWLGDNAAFRDLEVAVGWRVTPGMIMKTSYRFDRWNVDPSLESMLPDGHAFAVQLSYAFDVLSWFDAPR